MCLSWALLPRVLGVTPNDGPTGRRWRLAGRKA